MLTLATTTDRRAVGRLAVQQGGCITTWQLRWLGLAASTISLMRAREGWGRAHAGVFVLPGVQDTPMTRTWAAVLSLSPQDGPRRADGCLNPSGDPLDAALQAGNERVVVTGLSAAWLRGVSPTYPSTPQLLLASGHHPARSGIQPIRGKVDAGMWSWHRGLKVATGPRMLWDIAWLQRRSPGALDRIVDLIVTADRMRIMAVDELLALVEESVQFGLPLRVPRLLKQAAEEVRPGFSHSATEALTRSIAVELAASLGLTAETRPFKIRHGERVLAEADVAVVYLRHDAEIDGPHHDLRSQQQRDRRRDGRLGPIDWAVNRYPVAMINDSPAGFAAQYLTDLQARMDELS